MEDKEMAKMVKCPNCGSEFIMINGVVQQKKGFLYYLSGAAIQEAGIRSGYKAASRFVHADTNAECKSCGHKWMQK